MRYTHKLLALAAFLLYNFHVTQPVESFNSVRPEGQPGPKRLYFSRLLKDCDLPAGLLQSDTGCQSANAAPGNQDRFLIFIWTGFGNKVVFISFNGRH